jgi:hypothetical protein
MADGIFLIQGDKLTELVDQHFETEAVFQGLLASHPGLLAGGQINANVPRRWLLVRREMGIPGEQAGGDRWSVDHLFLDQDGVPTLVEVKRSTDTRLRRELVGQMLDYAANAVVYWPVEEIRSRFIARCDAEGLNPAEEMAAFLGGDGDAAAFWENVKTNLQARRVRMLFVADVIPPELRRIVEFLNEQIDPAEVLALEIKQYVSGELRTLVPRIIGQTAEAESKKGSSRGPARVWGEATFFASAADQCDPAVITAMRRLYEWGRMSHGIVWGKGPEIGSFQIRHNRSGVNVLYVEDAGRVYPIFGGLKKLPPFDEDDRRRELLGKLNAIPGVKLPEKAIDKYWRSFKLEEISLPDGAQQVVDVLSWALEEIDTTAAAGVRVT